MEPTVHSSRRWYARLAPIYDSVCRPLYAGPRGAGIHALGLEGGETVLDLCTGTGLNLPALSRAVGTAGRVVGLDASPEMLARAERKRRRCPAPLDLLQFDGRELDEESWYARVPRPPDAVLCSFGFAVAPGWRELFERSYALLAPGGRYVIVDNQPFPRRSMRWLNSLVVPMSNWAGHADLHRPTAQLLAEAGAREPQTRWHLGGYVHVTAAQKPGPR